MYICVLCKKPVMWEQNNEHWQCAECANAIAIAKASSQADSAINLLKDNEMSSPIKEGDTIGALLKTLEIDSRYILTQLIHNNLGGRYTSIIHDFMNAADDINTTLQNYQSIQIATSKAVPGLN